MKRKPFIDGVDFVSWTMAREKSPNIFDGIYDLFLYPLTFGELEIDHLFENVVGFQNVSTDQGCFELINRPEIYGYYRTSPNRGRRPST